MTDCCKLLIVDDEFIMRQGIKHMLDWEKEGFRIIGDAANGKEALDLIEQDPPHIVITDVIMPQMDGIELAKIIQKKHPNIQVIILSSYNDFEYVKTAFQFGVVDYILKPALNPAELLKTLKKVMKNAGGIAPVSEQAKHSDNLLNRLLLGFNQDIDFQTLEEIFPYSCFQLFGIRTEKAYQNYKQRHELAERLIEEINLDEFQDCAARLTDIEKETLVLVLNYEPKSAQALRQQIRQIAHSVCADFEDAFFVLSAPFDSIRQIKSNYENSFLPLTEQQFYHKGARLFSEQDVSEVTPAEPFDYKHFSEQLSMLQIQTAFSYLKTFVLNAAKKQSLPEFELKTLIQNALYNVITTLEGLSFNSSSLNALKHDYFDRLDQAHYAPDLIDTFSIILVDFESISETYQSKINSHIINKIIQYIYDHFNESLALADVAKMFNFNYYYLSSYFSTHNKEGFNEFLNKIRIEKATELLTKDIPIADISSMVGYSDHSYFCKVFKKFTGSTPSAYRKTAR